MRRREFVTALAAGTLMTRLEGQAMPDKVYGVGILGNCCTHGQGLVGALNGHPRTRAVAGHEEDERRGAELKEAMGLDLAGSYEAVADDPEVEILCVTSDPCDKAVMVELACARGKPVLLNKPMCESVESARRIEAAVADSGGQCVLDIPMVKGLAPYARLRADMAEGQWGRPIAYHHDFGMCFPMDFPIRDLWPERFDPPEVSGGGEMTNMGCYAIDYMVTLLGKPVSVQAKRASFWQEYADSPVENFGQIICDYGDFFATLSVGKQKLDGPHQGVNDLSIRFPNHNLLLSPYTDTALVNGVSVPMAEYVDGAAPTGSIDQLIRAIEGMGEVEDTVELGRVGVEVLAAAYASVEEGIPARP